MRGTRWDDRARQLKRELHALYLAYRDPRVPWYARVVAACVVGYAFSPLDLIPDPIPVLGYLDDLILVPAGILLARRLIPADLLAECRATAEAQGGRPAPRNLIAGGIIVVVWILAAVGTMWLVRHIV
ncbi:MAG TPA: YkvA family protein [Thermomicrobiales bacterium]|nr:YkvA family protein [Thermomicrobiales bacterium]